MANAEEGGHWRWRNLFEVSRQIAEGSLVGALSFRSDPAM